MQSILRRTMFVTGLVGAFSFAVAAIIGCGGASPFTSAQFATKLTGLANGGTTPTPTNPDDTNTVTASVCDLDAALQTLSITMANLSAQYERFSLTLAVSAGTGGWVCQDQIQDYINAGYADALVPGSGNTITIGCDTITLLSGTRLLTMQFGINQGASATLPPATGTETSNPTPTTLQLKRRDNGSALLPLPELIVLGNSDPTFICTGGATTGDLCSQRGFNYCTQTNLPVGKSPNAARTQGTVCNTGYGTAPEWRLDKTLNDNATQAYQYAAGGIIVATLLDRSSDAPTETRNQVVWLVTDSTGATIHYPAP